MTDERDFFGSREAAQQLEMGLNALQAWLYRHPEFRPTSRISGDDLLWTSADIERVKNARQRTKKHGNRYAKKD